MKKQVKEKYYKQPEKLYHIDKDKAFWPKDAEDYIWWSSEGDDWSEDYAKSYRVKISPFDFLDLTTEQGASNLDYGDSHLGGELRDLDIDEFNKERHQPIFLQIAFRDKNKPYRAQVVGHEGRHRMFALMKAGVKEVDIELRCMEYDTHYDKYKPIEHDWFQLIGQFNDSVMVQVYNPIPMSWKRHKEMRPEWVKEDYSYDGINFEFTVDQLYNILCHELEGLIKSEKINHLLDIFPNITTHIALVIYNKMNFGDDIDLGWWTYFTNLVNGEDSYYDIELRELDPEILRKEIGNLPEETFLEKYNITNIDKFPKFLYHATYEPYLKEIISDGKLAIKKKHYNWGYDEKWDTKDVIYLASDYDAAYSFAETAEAVDDELLDQIVVLEIPVSELDLDYLDIDSNNRIEFESDTDEEDKYYYQTYEYGKDIPFSICKVIREDDYMNESKHLNEYIETDKFELGTCGYIKDDGNLIILDEYHGEEEAYDLIPYRYPEFSNTHPEEDTCIRLWRKPTPAQYKRLEEIIDIYLDREGYCKAEIWAGSGYQFYKVFSLWEGACSDYQWDEDVGNWTGYKIVQIIKNYFNNLNEDKSKKSDKYIESINSNYLHPHFYRLISTFKGKDKDLYVVKNYNTYILNIHKRPQSNGIRIAFEHKYIGGSPIYFLSKEEAQNTLDRIYKKTSFDQGDFKIYKAKNTQDLYYQEFCEFETDIGNICIPRSVAEYNLELSHDLLNPESLLEELNESLLLEKTRNELISKSKKSDNYSAKNQHKGKNRWERRIHSRVSNTVRDYNKIDMDAFFKADILDFVIKVTGETDNYEVQITFEEALREIANEIKKNNNKLEFKSILRGLIASFNRGNVYVSCSCPDFTYRQAYWATKGQYNSGMPQPSNGKQIANPNDTKGAGCKHVNLVLANLDWMMKIASVVNNYIYYARDNLELLYAKHMFPKLYGMPYDKAIQLTFDMYDENGNLKDDAALDTSEDIINMSNMLGAKRTQYKKKPEKSVNRRSFEIEVDENDVDDDI